MSDEFKIIKGVPSPCISICAIDEATGLCKGCYRTVDEVASWLYYTNDQKRAVLTALEQRKLIAKQ